MQAGQSVIVAQVHQSRIALGERLVEAFKASVVRPSAVYTARSLLL